MKEGLRGHDKVVHCMSVACVALCAAFMDARADATYLGPTPYLSFDDSVPGAGNNISPFCGVPFKYFYLDTYEKGYPSTPGVVTSAGNVGGPGAATDSVDADDGVIDGIGAGRSTWAYPANSIRFTFKADILGQLPTHAGVVWTDIGSGGGYYGQVEFEAFGPTSNSLGVIGPFSVGDGSDARGTTEDRFFGVIDTNGVSAIRLGMIGMSDWEFDHLQYGRAATVSGSAKLSIKQTIQLSWMSLTNTLYQVQWAPQLNTNHWNNFGSPIAGTGATNNLYDPPEWRQRFYRILEIK